MCTRNCNSSPIQQIHSAAAYKIKHIPLLHTTTKTYHSSTAYNLWKITKLESAFEANTLLMFP